MNYDNDVLGVGNSLHPANQVDCERELDIIDQLSEENFELRKQNHGMREGFAYRKAHNAKIIEAIKHLYDLEKGYIYLHNKLNELM